MPSVRALRRGGRPAAVALAAGVPATLLLLPLLASSQPLTSCGCSDTDMHERWTLPSNSSTPPSVSAIASLADPSSCWQLTKTSGGVTCDGLCVVLGPCSDPTTPTWQWDGQRLKVASPPAQAGWCLDENTANLYLQAYPNCIDGDTHQLWAGDSLDRIHELWTGQNLCIAPPGDASICPPPPPPPGSEFCYQFHPIHAGNVYDPSGPFVAPDGLWHVWEDAGGWSHYTSRDLLHWQEVGPSTGFGGLTGSIAITPSGVKAFWPEGSQAGVDAAVSTDLANYTSWSSVGRVITAPPMAGGNFRDPLRAFQWLPSEGGDGSWYVGVGCNNNSQSADLCLFRAADDTLSNFSFAGPMFTATKTFGQMNTSTIVWVNSSVQATMMECPDVFRLTEDKWMLIGSLYSTNQWWIGTVNGSSSADGLAHPSFTPLSVGIMDYGNGYAAKTGSTVASAPGDRRVVFAFTGWTEPTADPACGRALIIPRDITLGPDGATPRINPIPELWTIVNASSRTSVEVVGNGNSAAPLTGGAQLLVNLLCTVSSPAPTSGKVFVRVLGSSPGAPSQQQFTEVGYDFGATAGGGNGGVPGSLYVDHSNCCAAPNSIVQLAPAPISSLSGLPINLTVVVDGGLIESFLNGLVTITALVYPDLEGGGPPSSRTTTVGNTAGSGVSCSASSYAVLPIAEGELMGGTRRARQAMREKMGMRKKVEKEAVGASSSPISLLSNPGPSGPAALYISPLNYNHSLLTPPAYSGQSPAPTTSGWYATQWSNPVPVNSTVVIPGPSSRCFPGAGETTAWRIDSGSFRACAFVPAAEGEGKGEREGAGAAPVSYQLSADGSGGALSETSYSPVQCGQEFDAFLAPTDGAYDNAPQNIWLPTSTPQPAPSLGEMTSLRVSFTAELLEWATQTRCGAQGSCGPSGKVDYAYAVLGLVLGSAPFTSPLPHPRAAAAEAEAGTAGSSTHETLFYQVILADTRASFPSCVPNDPCTTPFSYWFFDTLPTLGVSDSTNFTGLPCLRPNAGGPTPYSISVLERASSLIAEAEQKYGADGNMSHWWLTGIYIGVGLEGSAIASIRVGDVQTTFTNA